jgi:23S rRNA (uracil1939-C5)-methyltransferase
VSGPSFFQVNTAQAENLVEVVQEYAALQGGERLLDLFSGVGTFSLALASRAAEVIAVESSPWSAADAEANGEGVGNFTILEGSAGEVLPRLDGPFQAIVVDPPRSGCGKEVIEEIARLQPERLIYVSCDTATLARDSVYLHQAGLRLERMVALDMFPQTAHVETVARFIS